MRAWWLWGLTALALAVRAIGMNGGLWVDEIDSLITSFRPSLSEIVLTFPRDNRHPLYSVLAHLSIRVFGESAWAIRLPALLFGAATVPALYLLGTKVVSRRESFLAAALLAVSYHHAWFSQNARGYALLGFFAVLSAWLMLRCVEDPRPRWAVVYGAAVALGAWTHLTMVFVAAGHAASVAIAFLAAGERRGEAAWRFAALAIVLSAVFTLVLYAPVLGDVTHYFTERPSGLRGISTPAWAIAEAVRVLLAGLGGAGAALALAALAGGAIVFGAGLLALWRERPLALGMFVLPGLATVVGAALARGTMYPRFFFSMAPYGVLIAVAGAFAVSSLATARFAAARPELPERLATTLVAALIAISALSLGRLWRYPKQDFEGARRWVEEHRRPADAVATVDLTAHVYRDFLPTDWTTVSNAGELKALRAGRRVWLVYVFPQYLVRAVPDVHAVTEQECADAVRFRGTVGGGDVLVCELGPAS